MSSGFGVGQRWSYLRGIKAREGVIRGLRGRCSAGLVGDAAQPALCLFLAK